MVAVAYKPSNTTADLRFTNTTGITCANCGKNKLPTEFNKNRAAKNGRQGECRMCQAKRSKEYNQRKKSARHTRAAYEQASQTANQAASGYNNNALPFTPYGTAHAETTTKETTYNLLQVVTAFVVGAAVGTGLNVLATYLAR